MSDQPQVQTFNRDSFERIWGEAAERIHEPNFLTEFAKRPEVRAVTKANRALNNCTLPLASRIAHSIEERPIPATVALAGVVAGAGFGFYAVGKGVYQLGKWIAGWFTSAA